MAIRISPVSGRRARKLKIVLRATIHPMPNIDRHLAVVAWCALALACDRQTPTPPTTPHETVDDSGSNPASCPPDIETPPAACASDLRCTYPQGTCTCAQRPQCSGAERPPDTEPRPNWGWRCAFDPRPDGCPVEAPADGASCSERGKLCNYGDCCIAVHRCTDDGWKFAPDRGGCPP